MQQAIVSTAPAEADTSRVWLRLSALAMAVASAFASLVIPGSRGNATDAVVRQLERAGAASSYVALTLLLAGAVLGAVRLAVSRRHLWILRSVLLVSTAAVLSTTVISLFGTLRTAAVFGLMVATVAASAVAGLVALRDGPSRAAGVPLLLASSMLMTRGGAWAAANYASEFAHTAAFQLARGLMTVHSGLEVLLLIWVITWLIAKSRLFGVVALVLALACAIVGTWAAARGGLPGAPLWQAWFNMALTALSMPPPFGGNAISVFVLCAALPLSIAVATKPGASPRLAAVLALATLARGGADAPLRALALVVAALWAPLVVE